MARICPACGAENRDAAKFCLKCAQQLVSLRPSTETPRENSPRKRRKRKKSTATPETNSQDLLWMVLLILALLALSAALWRWAVLHDTAKPPAAPAQTSLPAPTTHAPESEALWQALRDLEAQAEQQAAQRAAQRAAENARQEEARHQAASATAVQRTETPARPREPERDTGITVTVEPLPSVPHLPAAPTPEPTQADTLCPGAGVFARARCLQTECNKPTLAQHPECIHMRELQNALQHSAGDG